MMSFLVVLVREVVRLLVILAETVETKYGELVVHDNDVVTYVGNKHWSVSHETMVGKSPDNQE